MALNLGDLNEFFDGGMLATVNGKQYRIPPVSAELGLWGRKVAVLQAELGDDPTEEEAKRIAGELGEPPVPQGQTLEEAMLSQELHAQLLADGVDDAMVQHMAQLVMGRIVGGDALAVALARGEDPKANRAQRRATKKAAPRKASGSKTTSTGKAATTRKPASGSGTTSRSTSSGAGKTKGSRGGKS